MRHEELRKKRLVVYDARGNRVAWVRGAEQKKDGVIVACLVPVVHGETVAKAAIGDDNDVAEMVGFISGGYIK